MFSGVLEPYSDEQIDWITNLIFKVENTQKTSLNLTDLIQQFFLYLLFIKIIIIKAIIVRYHLQLKITLHRLD